MIEVIKVCTGEFDVYENGVNMTMNEMLESYEEFQTLLKHPGYTLDSDELDEYHNLCADILYVLMEENKDVFERLKNR